MATVAEEIRGVKEGQKYGGRVVIGCPFVTGRFGPKKNKRIWSVVVKCNCGRIDVVTIPNLLQGKDNLCRPCHSRKATTKHGGSPSTAPRERLHNIWCSMRQRCNCETCHAYPNYGGRGIKVCEQWDSYESFREWAHSSGYYGNLTIDRIDNDRGYEPDNCQWISLSENTKKQWADKRRKAKACV